MRRRVSDESGWAMVTVVGLMAIVLSLALATMSQVDTQQKQSGVVRTKETAFNLAEAALNAQTFALAQEWPGQGKASNPYAQCTQSSNSARCPVPATLQSMFSSPDTIQGATWRTNVRDNATGSTESFYSDALTASAPGYDANGDGKLWVRSQATVNGRTRTLIALVRVEEVFEDMPHAAVITGRLTISNDGHKEIIDSRTGVSPTVSVRCTPQLLELTPCLGHQISNVGNIRDETDLTALLDHQLYPNVTVKNYQGGAATTAEARARLKATAIANGTYYTSCPSSPPAGPVVWIVAGTCTWTGNQVVNSRSNPGLMILENATVYLGGTVNYYGIIYSFNPLNLSTALIQVQGNAQVFGGVLIDGPGVLIAGSSKLNVELDDNAYNKIKSYVSAGMIQNTWREIRST
jgi:Tfp pilus assembly protein PilX